MILPDNAIPVVVTTEFRGVFFGYIPDTDADKDHGKRITLLNARNCSYWSTDEKGFLGLAAKGPGPKCRIGPPSDKISLYKITCVASVTPEAAMNWESAPWAEG